MAPEELVYESPVIEPKQFHFADHFDDVEASRKQWVHSQAKKEDIAEEIAKYDGIWNWESPQRIVWPKDKGLVLKSKAKHAAISSRLRKPFDFKSEKPLVVQYEVTMQVSSLSIYSPLYLSPTFRTVYCKGYADCISRVAQLANPINSNCH